jgi:Ca2+-binding RTX toxin-like protein
VDAGTGDDLIVGGEGAGNDTYVGGTGTDTVKYTSAVNTILVNLLTGLAEGKDIGTDQLSEIENLIGGQTGDTLIGDNNANNINKCYYWNLVPCLE